jgi:hypothetical protein
MSTLNVANISDGADTVETGYVVNGSAKAWVNFNGIGTVAIRDSLNVSSLTDGGVGVCTVGLTSSAANTDYCVTSAKDQVSLLTDSFVYDEHVSRSAAGFKLIVIEVGAVSDSFSVNAALLGDLA